MLRKKIELDLLSLFSRTGSGLFSPILTQVRPNENFYIFVIRENTNGPATSQEIPAVQTYKGDSRVL